MPSNLVVEVRPIDQIKVHPNADTLHIAVVGGWQCIVPISAGFRVGDPVVYFPPDTMIPLELSERLGVTKYLSNQRIRCTRLRGEPSFGLVIRPDQDWAIGTDVAEYYGATKYEPPVKFTIGDAERDHPLFERYTSIENLRNYTDVFELGEVVSVTEKIHGTNCRVGIVDGEYMAGSHTLRRKRPADDNFGANTYWLPLADGNVRAMLYGYQSAVLYCEVYGPGVQHLAYGRKARGYAAFDMMVNGVYLNVDDFRTLCAAHDIPMVPEIARVPYAPSLIAELARGKTVIGNGAHIREGVVVKPLQERTDPRIGRVVLKYVSDEYLLKQFEDFTDQ